MSTAYQTLILSEAGLVSYWPMNEPSGTTTTDSKDSHTCTVGGNFPPTLGEPGIPAGGTSYLFNGAGNTGGVDSYTKDASAFDIGGSAISVEAWVYIATNPGRGQYIAGFPDSGHQCYLLLSSGRVAEWALWESSGGGGIINGPSALSLSTWHHLVGTGVGSGGNQNFYIDSVAQTPAALPGTLYNQANAVAWAIGGGTNITFDAQIQICNVAVYNVALTPTQVTAHYTAGLFVGGGGLIGPTEQQVLWFAATMSSRTQKGPRRQRTRFG